MSILLTKFFLPRSHGFFSEVRYPGAIALFSNLERCRNSRVTKGSRKKPSIYGGDRAKSQKKAIALPAIGKRDRAIAFLEKRKPRFGSFFLPVAWKKRTAGAIAKNMRSLLPVSLPLINYLWVFGKRLSVKLNPLLPPPHH